MGNMRKEYLTVAEMADLCNVTKAALKHYERMGLLQPARIDEKTGYRYYSITQYERITTIRELRELHVSIPDIKYFMNDRNVAKSYSFLEDQYQKLNSKIRELSNVRESLKEQLSVIEAYRTDGGGRSLQQSIRLEHIDERVIVTHATDFHEIRSEEEDSAAIIEVEKLLNFTDKAATLARGRLGILIPQEDLVSGKQSDCYKVFGFPNKKKIPTAIKEHIVVLQKGSYVCRTFLGSIWERESYIHETLRWIRDHDLTITGDGICLNPIDDMVSDYNNEYVCEVQIPVR